MLEIKNRIGNAKAAVRRAEQQKTVAETQKTAAEQQLEEIKAKMLEAGVTPDTINDEIVHIEQKLKSDVEKVERLIPQDI